MMGDGVELCFLCPVTGRIFCTEQWEMSGCSRVCCSHDGSKRLQGRVATVCPLCGGEHAYSPEELPCPLSFGAEIGDECNLKGGE